MQLAETIRVGLPQVCVPFQQKKLNNDLRRSPTAIENAGGYWILKDLDGSGE